MVKKTSPFFGFADRQQVDMQRTCDLLRPQPKRVKLRGDDETGIHSWGPKKQRTISFMFRKFFFSIPLFNFQKKVTSWTKWETAKPISPPIRILYIMKMICCCCPFHKQINKRQEHFWKLPSLASAAMFNSKPVMNDVEVWAPNHSAWAVSWKWSKDC